MQRENVRELHYITPIENLAWIFQKGILRHKLVREVSHDSEHFLLEDP